MMISLIREENGTLFLRTMSVDNLIKRIRGPYVPPPRFLFSGKRCSG